MSTLFLISLSLGEFLSKSFKNIATILSVLYAFYIPAKPENINYDNLSYLLCIEFIQNELDPC